MDRSLYRYRHGVENAFAWLKQYQAIALRYDKLKRNFENMIAMACDICGYPCEMSINPSLEPKLLPGNITCWFTIKSRRKF